MESIAVTWSWLLSKVLRNPLAVITDQSPTLKTLWQYALRFRVEELFLEAQVGGF